MSPTNFGIKEMAEFLGLVDNKLKSLAPENIDGLNRLLNVRGKRLRPGMVIATAFYSGRKIDSSVINAAAAVELVHLASLVHDDIIDNGSLRWGVPTINSKEGLSSAVLAGDYLIAKGCSLAATISSEAGELMAETVAVLCEGQALELKDNFNIERTKASLLLAAKGKTSSMFIAACKIGGLVAGVTTKELKLLADFAENFGIYFQYVDDVKDFVESPENTGKSVGNDVREGNYTLPVILSLNGPNKARLKRLLKKNAADKQVYDILNSDGSISSTLLEAEKYKKKASEVLKSLSSRELSIALEEFLNRF